MPHESLKSLHTAIIDAREGYEDAESTRLAAFFRSMNILHAAHHTELHQALLEAGETPEDDGSFMSRVPHQRHLRARGNHRPCRRDVVFCQR